MIQGRTLALIVECNANLWISPDQNFNWSHLLALICSTAKILTAIHNQIHLMIFASLNDRMTIIYDSNLLKTSHKLQTLNNSYTAAMHESIVEKFQEFVSKEFTNNEESLNVMNLDFSLAVLMCYINKLHKQKFHGSETIDVLVISIHFSLPKLLSDHKMIKASNDVKNQYLSFVNCTFSAQRLGIRIFGISHCLRSTLLQQASEISGGTYYHSEDFGELRRLLFRLVLSDFNKNLLAGRLKERPPHFDHRTACFCHQKLIDIAFACSVCFSVFCKRLPSCIICGSKMSKA
ncbi:MAG: hypothetical protein MHMPM18_002082 [Marteilia pararefringens]